MYLSTISNSKHSLYLQCKLAYKYRYYNRYEGISKNELALNFGSYIHKIFEDGVNCTHISELEKLAEKHRAAYKIPNHYRDRTTICLQNFLRWNEKLTDTIGIEMRYEVDLIEGVTVNGIIDRVVKGDNGGILIVDYKTSKREKNEIDLFNDNQLKGYAYAVHKELGVPLDKITCSHYYPVTNNFVSIQYGNKRINIWKQKMVEDVWKIRKNKLEEMTPTQNQFCNWCNYKEACSLHCQPDQVQMKLNEWEEKKKDKL